MRISTVVHILYIYLALFDLCASVGAQTNEVWTDRHPIPSPSSRYYHSMAYDSVRAKTVLFGGIDGTRRGDTWLWDGFSWSLRAATGPSPRINHAMAFDSHRGEIVLFGGSIDGGGNTNDTWVFDGTTWEQKHPLNSPEPRKLAAMAFDSIRGRVVLFGGFNAPSNYSDTWEWDGSNWVRVESENNPSGRNGHALVFDPEIGASLLFGGFDSQRLNDTWLWNGTDWTKLTPTANPPARNLHSLLYSPVFGAAVLYGGLESGTGYFGDLWKFDGTTWIPLTLDGAPRARCAAGMVFDELNNRAFLFGGNGGTRTLQYLGETFALGPPETPTPTPTGTIAPTVTPGGPPTNTPTRTPTVNTPTPTPIGTQPTASSSATPTSTPTFTATSTYTSTPTETPPIATATPTPDPSVTPTITPTLAPPAPTETPEPTLTNLPPPTETPTIRPANPTSTPEQDSTPDEISTPGVSTSPTSSPSTSPTDIPATPSIQGASTPLPTPTVPVGDVTPQFTPTIIATHPPETSSTEVKVTGRVADDVGGISGVFVNAGLLGSTVTDAYGEFSFVFSKHQPYEFSLSRTGYIIRPSTRHGIASQSEMISFIGLSVPLVPDSCTSTDVLNKKIELSKSLLEMLEISAMYYKSKHNQLRKIVAVAVNQITEIPEIFYTCRDSCLKAELRPGLQKLKRNITKVIQIGEAAVLAKSKQGSKRIPRLSAVLKSLKRNSTFPVSTYICRS